MKQVTNNNTSILAGCYKIHRDTIKLIREQRPAIANFAGNHFYLNEPTGNWVYVEIDKHGHGDIKKFGKHLESTVFNADNYEHTVAVRWVARLDHKLNGFNLA